MFTGLFAGFEARLRAGLSRAVRNIMGGLCLLAGAAFLTLAAWLWLEPLYGAAAAAAIIGGVYLIAGLLFILIPVRPRIAVAPPAPAGAGAAQLIEAFLAGRAAGRAMRDDP